MYLYIFCFLLNMVCFDHANGIQVVALEERAFERDSQKSYKCREMAVSVSERGHIWGTCKGRLGEHLTEARLGEPRLATPWSLQLNRRNPYEQSSVRECIYL